MVGVVAEKSMRPPIPRIPEPPAMDCVTRSPVPAVIFNAPPIVTFATPVMLCSMIAEREPPEAMESVPPTDKSAICGVN